MRRTTPLGALARGLVAGAAGSAVQSLFFVIARRWEPHGRSKPFSPPDEAQRDERATETVARRFVEGFMRRGPLDEDDKRRGAKIVHYAIGAGFGAGWALARETFPAIARPLGVVGFGLAAWVVGDDLLYPIFKLGRGPGGYPLSTHLYAIAAHVVFAGATAVAAEAMRPRTLALAVAALEAARLDARLLPRLPRGTRSVAAKIVSTATRVRADPPFAIAVS